MKIIAIILFLGTYTSFAQIPDYFGDNTEWKCQTQQWGTLPPGCTIDSNYVLYFEDSTTFGAYTYQNLKMNGWTAEGSSCTSLPTYYEFNRAFLRQEGRKIYKYDNGADTLFMDYNLQIGDTIKPCWLVVPSNEPSYDYYIVQNMDSLLINSQFHRRFHFNNSFGTTWNLIEGVGHFNDDMNFAGLFFFHAVLDPFEFVSRIECYRKNGDFELGFDSTCNIVHFNVGLEENSFLTDKKLLKIVDYLGREVPFTPNTALIYMFDDGTTEKVFRTMH